MKKNNLILIFFIIVITLIVYFNFVNIFKADYYFLLKRYDLSYYFLNNINSNKLFIFQHEDRKLLDKYYLLIISKNFDKALGVRSSINIEKIKNTNTYIDLLLLDGLLSFFKNELGQAIKKYKEVLKINPNNKVAKINLESIISLKRQKDEKSETVKTNKKNVIRDNLTKEFEDNGFINYTDYLKNKKEENDRKNYW